MKIRPVLTLVAVAAAAFVVAAGLTRVAGHRAAAQQPTGPVARTAFTGLSHATGEPTLPSLHGLHPAPRTVEQASGPFDDRFTLHGLSFDGVRVRGSATVTSDVSDLLELQAVAGFYDREGRLLGTARHVHHLGESSAGVHAGLPSETERFVIAVPAQWRGRAVSAAVGVPVLVNE
jgi:hypothetical protein